ncbi:hypothetical protein ABT237_13255 [Streptomyces sp. NPDC001581]|uniref:hypothetical protein n=1 Tax=Streptomyces sp. NPDC001581 TaxID=3154386 RepID=UPI00331B6203
MTRPNPGRVRDIWHRGASGAVLLDRCGGLLIGTRDGPAIAAARLGGIDHRVLEGDALRARFPQHALDEGGRGTVITTDTGVHRARTVIPAVGLAAAQLALEGAAELPVGAFSPDRFERPGRSERSEGGSPVTGRTPVG